MRLAIICFTVGATLGLARCASAAEFAELPEGVADVCSVVAQADYDMAIELGDPLPDGAYERAMGLCEDAPMPFGVAVELANALGRYGVERSLDGSGWYPTTAAEDAAADGAP